MVPPTGTRDRDERIGRAGRFLAAAGRLVGFCLLAGAALAVFAAVLLLPEYARLRRARYELGRQQAVNADLLALIEANRRLIADLPEDPVLTKRLAMRQLGLWPKDEVVVLDDRGPRRLPPALVQTVPHPRPEPPTDWLMHAADRMSNPPKRRGLLLLAVAAVVAAVFLFPAREDRRERKPTVIPPPHHPPGH